ncbi:MAG: restriction endonuclease [Bacteroidetes bacterium]|nr:MAG: restriction endonuclease [Bacteroidota bacterium]
MIRFEHQTLRVGHTYYGVEFTESFRRILETHYGNGVKYFNLIHKGVKFNEYVGVLQIGDLIIEVLPKAEKDENEEKWRKILIGMLKAVGVFNVKAPSSSSLNIKSNFILDFYFELFIREVEYLLKKGLIKKYRPTEENSFALKGNILFGKHIQQNIVHKERFYIRHSKYDNIHLLHQILHETLLLLKRINSNAFLSSRIGSLLLNFPEVKRLKISAATFDKIHLNQKTEGYNNALEISRLLLLNYHPDLTTGHNDVLALMFDMNVLWERFVYVSMRKQKPEGLSVKAQQSKYFWESMQGKKSRMKPDILVSCGKDNLAVLDTKWKNMEAKNPSLDDLRQLYVYHEYYETPKAALVYPGTETVNTGSYFNSNGERSGKECSIISIEVDSTITAWQKKIGKQIFDDWLNEESLT